MPYCLAFGCTSNSVNNPGVHFHEFPRKSDLARRKSWIAFCRRADLTDPSKHSHLCSLHFSKKQYERDPEFMARYGYKNAKPKLYKVAVPDIPLVIPDKPKAKPVTVTDGPPAVERGAFRKRRRLEVLKDAVTSVDLSQSQECPLDSTDGAQGDQENAPELEPQTTQSSSTKHHFECQVSMSVPKAKVKLRTRRLQTLPVRRITKTILVKPLTRTVAVQCDLTWHSDPPQNNHGTDSDMDIGENVFMAHKESSLVDPDYMPGEHHQDSDLNDEDEENIVPNFTSVDLEENPHPTEEKHFLVSESALCKLLKTCNTCASENVSIKIRRFVGTMVDVETICLCGSKWWSSQQNNKQMPLGNLMLASATMLSGSSPAKVIRLFECMKMPVFCRQTYHNLQSCYVVPTIQDMWPRYQDMLLEHIHGTDVVLGGDARCDSPGYSAKYGSYTLMDLDQKLILDMQLVQSNEVKSSSHMELAGLKRGIGLLEGQGCQISELVTDRHVQVQKYMREEQSHIKHLFDVWHVAKGVQKKLEAVSKKKDCGVIRSWIKSVSNHMYWVAAGGGKPQLMTEKWLSVVNHVCNIHSGHGELYTECPHGPLDQDREWIKPGSRAYKALKEVVESKYLMRAIPKLSPLYQTYSLEVFHNVVNHFAPKSHHYFYPAMKARMYLSAFHYNENSRNGQAINRMGESMWRVSYPRAKKGTHCVAKPVNNGPTYEYVEFLLTAIMDRRTQFPSYKVARRDFDLMTADDPGFLTDGFVKRSKDELVKELNTRYKLKACENC